MAKYGPESRRRPAVAGDDPEAPFVRASRGAAPGEDYFLPFAAFFSAFLAAFSFGLSFGLLLFSPRT